MNSEIDPETNSDTDSDMTQALSGWEADGGYIPPDVDTGEDTESQEINDDSSPSN